MPQRGRPHLPPDKVRNERICVYCTASEKLNFVEHAKQAGASEIELGRKALRRYFKKFVPHEERPKNSSKEIVKADTSLYVPEGK